MLNVDSILIVDDDLLNLEFLCEILDERGYFVRTVDNGESALESVILHKTDLILLDILMPKLNGFEVCSRLKENPQTADIPVIFISGIEDVSEKVRGFEVGAVDFITKPFENKEVIARVETHLEIRRLRKKLEDQTNELKAINQKLVNEIAEKDFTVALLENDEYFGLLGDYSSDILVFIDKDGFQRYISPSVERITGFSLEELKKPLADFIHQNDKELFQRTFEELINNPNSLARVEYRHLHKDGSYRNFEAVGRNYIRDQFVQGVILNITDMTEKKKSEQAIRELEKIKSIHAMVVTANHELNQPLTVLKGSMAIFNKLFDKNKLTDKQLLNLDRANKALEHVEQILRKYREFESVKFGKYGGEVDMIIFDKKNENEEV